MDEVRRSIRRLPLLLLLQGFFLAPTMLHACPKCNSMCKWIITAHKSSSGSTVVIVAAVLVALTSCLTHLDTLLQTRTQKQAEESWSAAAVQHVIIAHVLHWAGDYIPLILRSSANTAHSLSRVYKVHRLPVYECMQCNKCC